MESFESELSRRTNNLAVQRLQFFKGCAIIKLCHLKFEATPIIGTRPLDEKNVDRLVDVFEIEGCGNLEPEHKIAALLDEETLHKALLQSNLTLQSLSEFTTQHCLFLEGGIQLSCVYGKHRLHAADKVGVREWLVDLYLDAISSEALIQLREESAKSLEFTDGEIYRTLREYQLSQNDAQEKKWWARFASRGRREDIRRLQLNHALLSSLDKLLPFIGLWKSLKTTHIERMLSLKFPEILCQYLHFMYERWSSIFGGTSAVFVDAASVHILEGLMPESSLEDRDQITDFIQSGLIFPLVSRVEDREAILQGLLSTPGRILSLKTLAQDTLFLDEPAWALRHLFPPFRGVSLQKIMRRHWQLVGAGEVQISEFNYCVIPPDTTNSFGICMLQLWLFALRHFTYRQPRSHISRKGSTEALGLANLALLATRLGFKSGQIEYLRSGNNSRSIAKDFLHSLCSEEFCEIEDSKLQTASRQLHSFLLKVQRLKQEEAIDSVLYTTDDRHDKAKHRFNRPTREQYTQQRKYLFIQHIFGLDQPASQYPTAIGVTRDILLSFFGDEARDILSTRQEAPSSDPRVQNMERNISDDAYSDMAHDSPTEGILDGRQIEYTVSDPLSNEHSNIAPKSPVLEPGSTQKALPDSPSSEYSSHPSNKPTSPRRESEQSIMDFEPHQSGTATPSIPMAPGFEDMLSISRMQVEAPIIPRRSTEEILILWSQSNKDVIVIWKFENRSYHKFSLEGGLALRSLLIDLSRENIFLCIRDDFGIMTPDINKCYEEAVQQRLLIVVKQDNPSGDKSKTTFDDLKEYIEKYDIHTGKRKANTGTKETEIDVERSRKRILN